MRSASWSRASRQPRSWSMSCSCKTGTHPAPMFKTALPSAAKPVMAADTPTATVPRPRRRPGGSGLEPLRRRRRARPERSSPTSGASSPAAASMMVRSTTSTARSRRRHPRLRAGGRPQAELEPNEALLQAVMRSPPKGRTTSSAAPVRPPAVVPDRPAPSKRVVAVQRALAEYGYGQIKPTTAVAPRPRRRSRNSSADASCRSPASRPTARHPRAGGADRPAAGVTRSRRPRARCLRPR